jgi:hypothetical protein
MRRLAWTAAMFALTFLCVVIAAATKSVVPVFVAWLPLLALVWALNRPDPTDANWPAPVTPAPAAETPDERPAAPPADEP